MFSIEKNIGSIARCITQLRERLPKLKQQILPHRGEQKNRKSNHEKKPIKILKKPAGSIRFGFYKPKTKKNQVKSKKPSQTEKTEPNRFKPVLS